MKPHESEYAKVCQRNRLLAYIGLTLLGLILIWKTNIMDSLFSIS